MLRDLANIYTPQGVGVWLCNAHKSWGGKSAIDLIEEGRFDEVAAAVDRLASGAYS